MSIRIGNILPGCEQTEKTRSEAKLGFDGEMNEIVQGEKQGALTILSLPGRGTVSAHTSQDGASIFSFGELDDHVSTVLGAGSGGF